MWRYAGSVVLALACPGMVLAADGDPQVYVVYSNQRVSDAVNARITTALAQAMPLQDWREAELAPGETLAQALDRMLDYFAKRQPGAMPRTTRELLKLVEKANPGYRDNTTTTRRVLLPNLPVRAHADYRFGSTLRAFDPAKGRYEIVKSRKSGKPTESSGPVIASIAAEDAFVDVTGGDDIRQDATVTSVATTLTTSVLTATRGNKDVVVLPRASHPGFTKVEWLQPPVGTCALTPWLASPYRALALTRLAPLLEAGFTFGTQPDLMLVDIDFSGNAHGAKVASVVRQTLSMFGVGDKLGAHVKSIDLAIKDDASAVAARELVRQFCVATHVADSPMSAFVEPTNAWIDAEKTHGGEPPQEVPVLLLQAVLWKAMEQTPFINLSFRLEDPASSIVVPIVRADRSMFVTVAAGNDEMVVLPPLWAPQDAATSMSGFVNVTYGDADGTVRGCRSNPGNNVRVVSVLAPGCGFQEGAVKPADAGSSLAAPFVAATAWVRHLLGDAPVKKMRSEVLRSARLLQSGVPASVDAGAFDVWRFLAGVGPHVVEGGPPEQVVSLKSPRLKFTGECNIAGGGDHEFGPHADKGRDFLVYKDQQDFKLVMRTVLTNDASQRPMVDTCTVTALKLTSDPPLENADTLEAFVARYKYVSF